MLTFLTKRDFIERSDGTLLGAAWTLLSPFFLISIYAFFFSEIFNLKYANGEGGKTVLIMTLQGLSTHWYFIESLNKSASILSRRKVYLTRTKIKVAQIINASFLSSSVTFLFTQTIIITIALLTQGQSLIDFFWAASIFLSLIFMLLLTHVVAIMSVYIKDIKNLISTIGPGMIFLSPIFYSIENINPVIKLFISLNPITIPILIAKKTNITQEAFETPLHLFVSMLLFMIIIFTLLYKKVAKNVAEDL